MLEALHGERDFGIEVCYVDADPAWRSRYGLRVPVLAAGDQEIRHFFLDLRRLQAWLSR